MGNLWEVVLFTKNETVDQVCLLPYPQTKDTGHQPHQPCHTSHHQRRVPGRLRMETGFPAPQSPPHGAPREDSGCERKDAGPDPEAHVKAVISVKLDFCICPYAGQCWVGGGEEDMRYASGLGTRRPLHLTGTNA